MRPMPYTRWLAGDDGYFPPSARGARVSGSGPLRYAFGCTTSASVEAGLTHNWPVPERGARREPRRSGATRGRNVPAGCEHGRGSGRWWEAGRDPGQPTGCAGLAAATHEPLVMRQDLLARRARSTTSPIT